MMMVVSSTSITAAVMSPSRISQRWRLTNAAASVAFVGRARFEEKFSFPKFVERLGRILIGAERTE